MNSGTARRSVGGMARRAAAMVLLAATALLAGASGCTSEGTKLCQARCDCEGCSMVETDDCLDDADDIERLAGQDGCSDAFTAYVSCALLEGTCSNNAWVAPTCASKATAIKSCSRYTSTFVRTACDEEQIKRTGCGLSSGFPPPPGVPQSPCTGVDACVATCALTPEATCEILQDPVAEDAYSKCVNACNKP